MNKLHIVADMVDRPFKPPQPFDGRRVEVMVGTLERAREPAGSGCGCAHPGCMCVGEWTGEIIVSAVARPGAEPVLLTFRMPMLCSSHALAATYQHHIPPHLAATIRTALAERGFGPNQASADIELRAA